MSMRNQAAATGIALMLCPPLSMAQGSLAGTYSGAIEMMLSATKTTTVPVKLNVTVAENGRLGGKLVLTRGGCKGEYPLDGNYDNPKVEFKVGEGPGKGCGYNTMNLTAQEGKLVGKWGPLEMNLSK